MTGTDGLDTNSLKKKESHQERVGSSNVERTVFRFYNTPLLSHLQPVLIQEEAPSKSVAEIYRSTTTIIGTGQK